MNFLGLLGIGGEFACDAVVETHADGDEQITFLRVFVRSQTAVHAEHAHVERMAGGQSRKTEERASGRCSCFFDEGPQFFACVAQFNALSDKHQWALGLVDQFGGFFNAGAAGGRHRHIAAYVVNFRRHVCCLFRLCALREIEHHGARTAAACDVECAAHGPGHVFGGAYLVGPFADGLHHVDHIAFLEGVRAEHLCGNLPCDDNNRRAVHHGVGHAGDRVGGSRTARDQAYANFTADTREAFSGVGGSLFVTHENVVEAVAVVIECIIHRHDGASGIAEKRFHPFVNERAHQYFCSRYGSF